MEKTRKIKIISLCALLVAVLGLTVAFAALSQTLTINGSAAVDTASWDIHFEKTSGKETEVKGAATFTEPTLNGTSIENFGATLTKPGDSVTYYFDIVNNGTVDAVVSYYNFPTTYLECFADMNSHSYCSNYDFDSNGIINVNDSAQFMQQFSYGIFYTDTNKEIKKKDVIKAGETKHMKLSLTFNSSATELPKGSFDLTSTSLPIKITYEQKD